MQVKKQDAVHYQKKTCSPTCLFISRQCDGDNDDV